LQWRRRSDATGIIGKSRETTKAAVFLVCVALLTAVAAGVSGFASAHVNCESISANCDHSAAVGLRIGSGGVSSARSTSFGLGRSEFLPYRLKSLVERRDGEDAEARGQDHAAEDRSVMSRLGVSQCRRAASP
jgi:hypothetical protein